MVYDDSNRAFLQAFMARRILTFDEAKPILSTILSGKSHTFLTNQISFLFFFFFFRLFVFI